LPEKHDNQSRIYRILDANINRLREALRVIEEYYRFMAENKEVCVTLKELRHSIEQIEAELGKGLLLENRDTSTDCFAGSTRPEELARKGMAGLLGANFKRGQEATRVIEEYSKIVSAKEAPLLAKQARFTLYNLEKKLATDETN